MFARDITTTLSSCGCQTFEIHKNNNKKQPKMSNIILTMIKDIICYELFVVGYEGVEPSTI